MDYRAIVIGAEDSSVTSNAAGRSAAKNLKKVLYSKIKKGEI
jgi:hypothetical protein